jgi:hypothetical protein
MQKENDYSFIDHVEYQYEFDQEQVLVCSL